MEQITSILVGSIISLLAAAVTWLFVQLRALKAEAVKVVDSHLPEPWDWLAYDLARTAVRAAYQLFPPEDTAGMLEYATNYIIDGLQRNGVNINETHANRIRAIIEAAVADFYIELGKPELLGR
jgi:hypothetical protein